DLQAESFTPGCASGKPSTKIVFGGDSDKLGELNIPKEWKSKVDVNDMDVLRGASTAQELPKSPIERVSGDAVADHEQHAVSEASHPASYAVDLVSHVSKAKTYEDAVELYNDAVNVVPKDEQFTMLGTPKTEKGITTVTWLRPGGNHDNPDDHIIYRNENGKESWVCGAGVGDVIIPPQKTSKGYALARVQNGNVSIVAGEKDAILNIKNRKDHEVAEVSDLRKAISKYVVHGVERSTNPVRRSHREDYGRAP
ncbi:MAG: hypothetical protein V4485_05530, partial [Pseudomonadota bacterium]